MDTLREDIPLRERLMDPNFLASAAEVGKMSYSERGEYHRRTGEHEILNREYVVALAQRIGFHIQSLIRTGSPITILEVGAGTGRLIHFLETSVRSALSQDENALVRFIGVDNQSGSLGIRPIFNVEKMNVHDAYRSYDSMVIVASWPSCNWLEQIPSSATMLVAIGPGDLCNGGDDKEPDGWQNVPGFTKGLFREATAVQTSKEMGANTIVYERNF